MRAFTYHLYQVLLVTVLIASTAASTAAVISRDWKTPGDGLLTYDDVNHREWLDIAETQLFKFPGATLEEQYQAVVSELIPGGKFAGFVVASNPSEIRLLGESVGIDTSTRTNPMNLAPATTLIDLLGMSANDYYPRCEGMLNRIEGRSDRRWKVSVLNFRSDAGMSVQVGDRHEPRAGVWLYRQVPEPSAYALFGAASVLVLLLRYLDCRKVAS